MRGPQLTLSGTTLTLRAVGVSGTERYSQLTAWCLNQAQTRGSSSDHPSWKVPENQKSNYQALLPCHHFFIHHLPLFCLFRWSPAPASTPGRCWPEGPGSLCPVGFPQPNVNELRQGFH